MKYLEQILKLSKTGEASEIVPCSDEEDYTLLHRILIAPHVTLALAIMERSGFITKIIPEISDAIQLQSQKHFKEIWPHTIRVVGQTPTKLTIRWAALFHDLGKAKTFSIKNNKVTFHHHEIESARIFKDFSKRISIFNKYQKERIHFLVRNLGWIEGYERSWTDSAVRRFLTEMGEAVDDLFALSLSDITTGNPKTKNKILNKVSHFKDRIEEVRRIDAESKPVLPKGLGIEISKALNIPLGPRIGEIRKLLEIKVKNGELEANGNFDVYLEFIKNSLEVS